MDIYVIDTNIFFNLEVKSGLGDNPRAIIEEVTRLGKTLKEQNKGAFYMPPRILEEFLGFVDVNDSYVKDFMSTVVVKAPDVSKLQFPGEVFYKLVEEMRHRSYRGLQVSEEELINAGKSMLEHKDLSHIDFQKAIGEHTSKLRDRYRQATRFKFLDSVADLDLLMLAQELNGAIITSDEGVTRWARIFGIKEIVPQVLKEHFVGL
jgi:RNA ligase partner protein